jgi:nicotinamide mononucleotide adenylyltransferase
MYIFEVLAEGKVQQTVAVYPGRFHPFHKGHRHVYDYLSKKYDRVYIATSGKVETNSPFTFDEKKKMMMLTGIPANAIVQEPQPYIAKNILSKFNDSTTAVVFGVGAKDMAGEAARFKPGTKKDGSPTYYQNNTDNKETFDTHGYLEVVPTATFKVLGKDAKSASELRKQYSTLNDQQAQRFITDLFGQYDAEVQDILDTKLGRNNANG